MRERRDQVITNSHGSKDLQAFNCSAESGPHLSPTIFNALHNTSLYMNLSFIFPTMSCHTIIKFKIIHASTLSCINEDLVKKRERPFLSSR